MITKDIIRSLIRKGNDIDDKEEDNIGLTFQRSEVVKQQYQLVKKRSYYQKLNMLLNLKALQGEYLLKAILRKIEIHIQLFQCEIEEQMEAYIP